MKKFSELENAKVLIVGGVGFIGSNLAQRLVKLGSDVAIIDSLIPEYGGNLFNIENIKNKVYLDISDVRDSHHIQNLIKGHDYLFNMVGQTSHLDSMQDPYTDLEINCKAQLSILEACRYYNPGIRIIFASTRQVYGKPNYLPVDEKHPLSPVDINGVNKIAGEWYHILYNNVYNINSCILRLTNTYGPGMRVKDARQTFVGTWISHLVQGKPFEVWNGEQLRDFTYVDDAVEAMLLAATDKRVYGQIFNLGGDCTVSLKELADLLIEINRGGEYVVQPFPLERKKIDIGNYYSDCMKIHDALGWASKISLRDGLSRTIGFYRKYLKHYI